MRDAIKYLHAVIEKKRCVPFRRFNGGVGRYVEVYLNPYYYLIEPLKLRSSSTLRVAGL